MPDDELDHTPPGDGGYDPPTEDGYQADAGVDPAADWTRQQRARLYRPGRGGFDPEAAELAAKAKYGFRQRMVLGLLAVAVLSAVLALLITLMLWWLHVAADLTVVCGLTYLRRQVRIEEEVRQRRAARLVARSAPEPEHYVDEDIDGEPVAEAAEPLRRPVPPPVRHPTAVVVDADDEDPAFEDLDATMPAYRRAVGE